MHPFERYRTPILTQAHELTPSPVHDDLLASGYTLVRHWMVRLRRGHGIDLEVALGFDAADDAYLPVLWEGHPVRATATRRLGDLPADLAAALGSTRADAPREAGFTWVDERHVRVTVPLVIASRDDYCVPAVRRSAPATVTDVLADLAAFDAAESVLTAAVHRALERPSFLEEDAVERVTPVRDAVAIELWDLRGSPGREDTRTFDGAAEARRFAWELSALLSHAVYHVSQLGRWRDRRPEQVVHELSHGYTFVHDHVAVANATCCLEVL